MDDFYAVLGTLFPVNSSIPCGIVIYGGSSRIVAFLQRGILAIFISGTGTNVGKTILSALIMSRYARELTLAYHKPVQTGDESDAKMVADLSGCGTQHILPEIYSLALAASPHFAAESEAAQIDIPQLISALTKAPSLSIIELAGGLLVPLARYFTNLDLITAVGFQTILVAATGLGTINHTVLSLNALRAAGGVCAGVFFVGQDNPLYADNVRTITDMTGVKHLGEFFLTGEHLTTAEFQARAKIFDPLGKIKALFQ